MSQLSLAVFFAKAALSPEAALPYITFVIRLALPVLAGIVLYRCIRSLFAEKNEKETWGWLSLPNGARIELNHWENVVGRGKSCDVLLEYPTISRTHMAIIRNAAGEWMIYDLGSKGGVILNGVKIDYSAPVTKGDLISLAGVDVVFIPQSREEERLQAEARTRPGRAIRPSMTFLLLTEFQALLMIQHSIAAGEKINWGIPVAFAALCGIMWAYFFIVRALRRTGFEIETIAFFLCSVGMSVTASSAPSGLVKQAAILLIAVALFFVISWLLRNLERVKKLRWPAAAGGAAILIINLILAKTVFGAKNWIEIWGITFQPSEFVKICFIFAGAATLDRLFTRRNLVMFIAFSGASVIALTLMSDFGTAAVFFVAYLVISYIRSGDIATVFLSVGGAGLAGVLAVAAKPYIMSRFATWGKAWEMANAGGYQQTRTMSAAASGGLFGAGAGEGWLHKIVAADTDMVFGMVCEELGLIMGLFILASIVALIVFALRSASTSRSSYYTIAACAAVSMMAFQVILNVFGSLDILPFTGVTFPFVSKGGSSLVACWGLLAFVKAADTRQNASFAVKLPGRERKRRVENEAG